MAIAFLIAGSAFAAYAAEIIKPNIGEPLRDVAVTRSSDGTYYLTGTRAMSRRWTVKPGSKDAPYYLTESALQKAPDGSPDFMDNDGAKVWSSKDLVNWTDEGLVWDLMAFEPGMYSWRGRNWALPERKVGDERVRGLTSPKFFQHEGHWYLVESYCGHEVGLLRSQKYGIKGPYDIHYKQKVGVDSRIGGWGASRGPGHGSLFRDKDGSVHLVWGPGYIVKMSKDLTMPEGGEPPKKQGLFTGPQGQPRDLLANVAGYPHAAWCAGQFAPHAASVYLDGDNYLLVWSAMTDESGVKREGSFVASAKNLDGPYCEPRLLVPGSGPAVLFDGGDKGLMLACSMDNAPALIPLKREGGILVAQGLAAPQKQKQKPVLPGTLKMYDYANSKPSGKWHQPHPETGRSKLVPLFDLPLRDICIARGGDGAWYLTGTVASKKSDTSNLPDFENNDGIYLWKSSDPDNWTPMGKVWDIATDTAKSPKSAWQLEYRVPANNPTSTEFARGITAPEVRFAAGTYWIPYSMNGRGTGLLKSASGKPEGPYEDIGRLTGMDGSPSLFVENPSPGSGQAGRALWLWGDLRAAKMKDDLSGLDGAPASLYLQLGENQYGQLSDDVVDLWDDSAPHLFTAVSPGTKAKKYYLTWSAIAQGTARALRETFIAEAVSPLGPYTSPIMMIPHGGQTSVFEGPERAADGIRSSSKLYASFYGADPSAVFRDRPGIVPVAFDSEHFQMPRKVNYNYYTHRGPWDSVGVSQTKGVGGADFRLTFLPDGNFYYGGSKAWETDFDGGVPLWRSPDLEKWDYMGHLYTHAQGAKEKDWPDSSQKPGWLKHDRQISWTTGLYYLKGGYYLKTGMMNVPGKACNVGPFLRSASGKPEGPYAFHAPLGFETLFEDEDGKVYGVLAAHTDTIIKMTDDLKALDKEWIKPLTPERSFKVKTTRNTIVTTDCNLLPYGKVDGKYLWGSLNGWRGYCGRFYWSDNLLGPLREIGTLPYMGHGMMARGKDGVWHTPFQYLHAHHFMSSPTVDRGAPPFLPVHVDMKANPPVIAFEYDYEAGVREMSVYGITASTTEKPEP